MYTDLMIINTKEQLTFVCHRCGECCNLEHRKNCWLNSNINEGQKTQLEEQRQQYSNEKGCRMLVFEGNWATCLVQKLFGFEAKPKACQESPFGVPQNFCYWYKEHILGMQDE